MAFGLEIYNESGVQTLGMGDFTIEKIFQATVPKRTGGGSGHLNSPVVFSVPGYNPSTCFVIITPLVYAGYDQPGYDDNFGMTPYYTDLGGTSIGIIDYCNYYLMDFNGNYNPVHTFGGVASQIEVVRVL